MSRMRSASFALLVAGVISLMGCGGGGGGGSPEPPPPSTNPPAPPIITGTHLPADVYWQPPVSAVPATGNFIYLQSEGGDAIGGGSTRLYTDAESTLTYRFLNGWSHFSVGNPELQWSGRLVSYEQPGFYGNVSHRDTGSRSLWFTNEWRDCPTSDSWVVIDAVTFGTGGLQTLDLRFAQRCEGSSAALRGKLRWRRSDVRTGPIDPMPAGLWQPPASAVPATGSYLYLQSDAGDYVGEGGTQLFTKDNSTLDVFPDSSPTSFYIVLARAGMQRWSGGLMPIDSNKLTPGYYPGVQQYTQEPSGVGSMAWAKNGRRCGLLNGWYAVDSVTYFQDYIIDIELRFEQRCDRSSAALRGKLRWSVFDFLPPPGPVAPPPPLWQAPAGAVPASGDYVYLESEPGDAVGLGQTHLYTTSSATLRGAIHGNAFHSKIDAAASWVGDFEAMSSVTTLVPGYHGDLKHLSGRDASKGGLAWTADGRACGTASGWVVVDAVQRTPDGEIAELDLRFEQRCAGAAGALRGQLRWTAAQSQGAPLSPVPPSLWHPPAAALPVTGNYVYTESDYADGIAGGRGSLDTSANAVILGGLGPDELGFMILSGSETATGRFRKPAALTQWTPGLYGNLRSEALYLPNGGLGWTAYGWTCSRISGGWFAIDAITYAGAQVTSVELRFEQACDGFDGSLRGKLRWSSTDPTSPPGPTAPPTHLWSPPAGATPADGSFVYLESEYGEFVARGQVQLYTSSNAQLVANGRAGNMVDFSMTIDPIEGSALDSWEGSFRAMDHLERLVPGYYPDLGIVTSANPAKGGLVWRKSGVACNQMSGWTVVDSVSYSGDELVSIEMRFEQHCDRNSAPLRGKVRWQRP